MTMNLLFLAFLGIVTIGGCSSFALTPILPKSRMSWLEKNGQIPAHKEFGAAPVSKLRFKGRELRAGAYDNDKSVAKPHVLSSLFTKYNNLLDTHPLATKVVSSGVLGAVSDVIVQSLSQRNLGKTFQVDYRRVLVFTTVCGLYFAPVVDGWFTFLSKIPLPSQLSGTSKAVAMMILDQTLGALIVTSGFFFAFELAQRMINPSPLPYMLTIFEAGQEAVKRNLLSTIQASWYCWPLINFLNFRFIPPQYRLLVTNIASIFWNMYLTCVVNNR